MILMDVGKHRIYVAFSFTDDRPFYALHQVKDDLLDQIHLSDLEFDEVLGLLSNDFIEYVFRRPIGEKGYTKAELKEVMSTTTVDIMACAQKQCHLEQCMPFVTRMKICFNASHATLAELQETMVWLEANSSKFRCVMALLHLPAGKSMMEEIRTICGNAQEDKSVLDQVSGCQEAVSTAATAMEEAVPCEKLVGEKKDLTTITKIGSFCEIFEQNLTICRKRWELASAGVKCELSAAIKKVIEIVEKALRPVAKPCVDHIVAFHDLEVEKVQEDCAIDDDGKTVSDDRAQEIKEKLGNLENQAKWMPSVKSAMEVFHKVHIDLDMKVALDMSELCLGIHVVHFSILGSISQCRAELARGLKKASLECVRLSMLAADQLSEAKEVTDGFEELGPEYKALSTLLKPVTDHIEENEQYPKDLVTGFSDECKTQLEKCLLKERCPDPEREQFWPATLSSTGEEIALKVPQPENLEQALKVFEMAGKKEEGLQMQVAFKVDGVQRALVAFYGAWSRADPLSDTKGRQAKFETVLWDTFQRLDEAARSLTALIIPLKKQEGGENNAQLEKDMNAQLGKALLS